MRRRWGHDWWLGIFLVHPPDRSMARGYAHHTVHHLRYRAMSISRVHCAAQNCIAMLCREDLIKEYWCRAASAACALSYHSSLAVESLATSRKPHCHRRILHCVWRRSQLRRVCKVRMSAVRFSCQSVLSSDQVSVGDGARSTDVKKLSWAFLWNQ